MHKIVGALILSALIGALIFFWGFITESKEAAEEFRNYATEAKQISDAAHDATNSALNVIRDTETQFHKFESELAINERRLESNIISLNNYEDRHLRYSIEVRAEIEKARVRISDMNAVIDAKIKESILINKGIDEQNRINGEKALDLGEKFTPISPHVALYGPEQEKIIEIEENLGQLELTEQVNLNLIKKIDALSVEIERSEEVNRAIIERIASLQEDVKRRINDLENSRRELSKTRFRIEQELKYND